MITPRHLRVLRSAGVGVGSNDVEEWADAISASCAAGVLRLGDYSACLIDKLAGVESKPFTISQFTSNTYGEYPTRGLR